MSYYINPVGSPNFRGGIALDKVKKIVTNNNLLKAAAVGATAITATSLISQNNKTNIPAIPLSYEHWGRDLINRPQVEIPVQASKTSKTSKKAEDTDFRIAKYKNYDLKSVTVGSKESYEEKYVNTQQRLLEEKVKILDNNDTSVTSPRIITRSEKKILDHTLNGGDSLFINMQDSLVNRRTKMPTEEFKLSNKLTDIAKPAQEDLVLWGDTQIIPEQWLRDGYFFQKTFKQYSKKMSSNIDLESYESYRNNYKVPYTIKINVKKGTPIIDLNATYNPIIGKDVNYGNKVMMPEGYFVVKNIDEELNIVELEYLGNLSKTDQNLLKEGYLLSSKTNKEAVYKRNLAPGKFLTRTYEVKGDKITNPTTRLELEGGRIEFSEPKTNRPCSYINDAIYIDNKTGETINIPPINEKNLYRMFSDLDSLKSISSSMSNVEKIKMALNLFDVNIWLSAEGKETCKKLGRCMPVGASKFETQAIKEGYTFSDIDSDYVYYSKNDGQNESKLGFSYGRSFINRNFYNEIPSGLVISSKNFSISNADYVEFIKKMYDGKTESLMFKEDGTCEYNGNKFSINMSSADCKYIAKMFESGTLDVEQLQVLEKINSKDFEQRIKRLKNSAYEYETVRDYEAVRKHVDAIAKGVSSPVDSKTLSEALERLQNYETKNYYEPVLLEKQITEVDSVVKEKATEKVEFDDVIIYHSPKNDEIEYSYAIDKNTNEIKRFPKMSSRNFKTIIEELGKPTSELEGNTPLEKIENYFKQFEAQDFSISDKMNFCKKIGRRFPIGYSATEDKLIADGYKFVGQEDGNAYYRKQEGKITKTIGVELRQSNQCVSNNDRMLWDNSLYKLGETELVIYERKAEGKSTPETLAVSYGEQYMAFISYNGTPVMVMHSDADNYIKAFKAEKMNEDEFKNSIEKLEESTLEKLEFNYGLTAALESVMDKDVRKCYEMDEYLRNYDYFSPTHDPQPYGTDELQVAYEKRFRNIQRISQNEAKAGPAMTAMKNLMHRKTINTQKLS